LLGESFRDSSIKGLSTLGGYSLPGVLQDCNIPPDIYPLQSDGLTLREIASKLINPFGLSMVVDSSVASVMDEVVETSMPEPSQIISTYLAELAAQRNIVLGHDVRGNIMFTRAKTNQKPITHFERGVPGTEMAMSFNGQSLHSHITVIRDPEDED